MYDSRKAADANTYRRQIEEANHRIANQLQTVAAYLRLMRNKLDRADAHEVLRKAGERVAAIARFHRYLARHGNASGTVNFAQLLNDSVEDICAAAGIDCALETEDIDLEVDKALRLLVAVSELALNAHKHGYENVDGGRVQIACRREDRHLHLSVSDRGRGLPADFDLSLAKGLGLAEVVATANQCGGTLQVRRLSEETRFELVVPVP